MSVLFVDLAGFTSLAESMDPEDVRRIQSRYFEVARSVVATYGGTIEKFIGDAVMAVWGAPAAHEDDAERAVRAALAIVYAVDRIDAGREERLRARAAVTSGEAAVTIGPADQGMVAGDLVNVAARLQNRAPVGGVLVDEGTRKLAPRAATYARARSLSLKGRAGRMAAYVATASESEPLGRPAGVHGGPFVGRERELRELKDLLRAVTADRRSRLVSVTGIAGIGKSRLAWELDRWVDGLDESIAWHDGRSPPYGEGIAFAAVAEMVRRRIRVDEAAPPEIARRQLASGLEEYIGDEAERRWIEPRLAALIDGDEMGGFDRDELFAAWRRFFERVSDRMPVVMVFEDLQWADPGLVAFIEHLATWSRQRPILILTLARPEFLDQHPSWGTGNIGSATAMHLEPLDDAAMRLLLEQRAPGLTDELVRRILGHAGGIPLYAVEVARIVTQPRDEASGERRRSTRGPSARALTITVPDTLHGLIAARIDSIPPDERRLLLSAAVLGHRFRPDALVTVTGDDPTLTRQRIDGLVRRELLTVDEELNSPGRGELTFVQDLVRDVAYRTLGHRERRVLHVAAARYLESIGDDVAEPLAGHLVEAHRLTSDPHERTRLARRAVAALRHAARRSMLLHVPARALGLLERAVSLVEGSEQRAQVLEEAAEAARAAARMEVAERHLREVISIREASQQRQAAARTRARLASVLLSAQRNEPALDELETAMRSVRGWKRDPSGVEIAAQLARARLVIGEDAEALRWTNLALEAARRLEMPVIVTDLLVTRGTALLSVGDQEAGLADLHEAIAQAEHAGALHVELRARNNLAWSLLFDDPRAALDTAREGFDLGTTMGLGDAAVPLGDVACTAAVETGDWDWAMATIEDLQERGVSDAYRLVLAATAAIIRSLRGEPAPMDPVEALGPIPPDIDTQVLAAVQHSQAWAAFVGGEIEDARRLALASITGYLGSEPAYQRALATRACLWIGDLPAARDGLAGLEGTSQRGRAALATSLAMRAGVAALAGDDDAGATFRRADEAWAALELPLQRGLCLLDRHRLLGGDPTEAATVLDALGAVGLMRLLGGDGPGAISERPSPRRRARSRRPSERTAARSGGGRRQRPAPDPDPPPG